MKKIFVIIAVISIFAFNINAQVKNIKIFFTGNTNGHPLAFTDMNESGQGGIPARATLVKEEGGSRYKNNVLLLDAGGVFGGRPESNMFNGMPDIVGMNTMKYDCAAIGIPELQRTAKDFELLNQKCEFTYIGANVSIMNKITKRTELLSDDYFIKKVGGLKVGIFSVITEDAKYLIRPSYQSEYIISDPIKAANSAASKLKREKNCDIVIALTYLGYYPEDPQAMDTEALANNIKNVDIIIDGRTSIDNEDPDIINEIPIFQVGKWGLSVGEINLIIKNNKVAEWTYKIHPVNRKVNGEYVGDKTYEDDFVTLAAIKGAMATYDAVAGARLCKVDPDFDFDITAVRFAECDFGNLLCDAVLEYTGADAVLMNTGGIDPKAKVDPNKITRKSFDNVITFDNPVVVIAMTGKEIRDSLQYSINRKGYGSFLQIAGITCDYNSRGQVFNVCKNGLPLEDHLHYRVAVSSWMLLGGDGYGSLKNCPVKAEASMLIREILYNYAEEKEILTVPKGGRINAID